MAELTDQNNTPFTKKSHRPWNAALLEQTVKNSNSTQITIDPSSFKQQTINNDPNKNKTRTSEEVDPLKLMLKEKNSQKSQLINQITDKSNSSLLLGGFFQPNNMQLQNSGPNGRKINSLIHDLKSKEQEITSLTASLKIAEATEKAEQAEIIRQTEEHARLSAEQRMKKAIEQVHVAASQLGIAIEKAQLAEQAQKEEEKARRIAEGKVNKTLEQARLLELALQNEIQAKKAAEDKAQISLNQTIQTELARQEIEGAKKKLDQDYLELTEKLHNTEIARYSEEKAKCELQQQFNRYQEINEHDKQILEKALQNSKVDNTELNSYNNELQNQIIGLEELIKQQQQQLIMLDTTINSLQNQQNKLQQIIETEQNLRKLAEQKASSALASAAKAELSRKEMEQQIKLIDDRAKRAVAHASKTVMKFLDSPISANKADLKEKELDDNYLEELLK
ncbi:MAG: hypothetical protein ABSA84_00085 [Gammaproteobacteria bacterium]